MFNFLRRQQWYHLFGCETITNRATTAQSTLGLHIFGVSTQFGCAQGPLTSKKDDVTISFRMMTSSANCLTSKMFT